MRTGFQGTFVISMSQTEVDDFPPKGIDAITVGATWSWRGDMICVDGPSSVLRLEKADTRAGTRKRAARLVRKMVGAAMTGTNDLTKIEIADPFLDRGFVVTNGVKSYTITVIETGTQSPPLLMFHDDIPPKNTDMWVVHHSFEGLSAPAPDQGPDAGGVICFTPGTRIATPDGPRLIEELREGDRVSTRDNGAEEIQWIGSRRMSGARLFALPRLRPIRFRAGALGIDRPDEELLVSPEHRMLIKGDEARALFNTDEVLVAAKDLINKDTIRVDLAVREVTYIHLLLPRHQILWANGLETESFHPASASLDGLDGDDRDRLLAQVPALRHDPQSYGMFARRCLSGSEAAIWAHEAA